MTGSDPEVASLEKIRALCAADDQVLTSRRYPAATYLDRLTPHLRGFGISRLADVTGLDRLGIPVVQAIRPLALSNAVNQGKGLTLAEAAVSAIVEALETYACERLDQKEAVMHTSADLFGRHAPALSGHLAPDPPPNWDELTLSCVSGIDPLTGEQVDVPLALVSTDYSPSSKHASAPFLRTTTGLGGGATLQEAISHGFLEVLERLSTDRAMRTHGFFERCRLSLDDLLEGDTDNWLAPVRAAKLLVAAYEAPPVGPFPTVWVRLLDERTGPVTLPYPADGFACRASIREAFRAALLEAVQTRGAVIAGGREDITWRFYPKTRDDQEVDFERRQIRDGEGRASSVTTDPGPVTLKRLTHALATAGQTAVIVPVLSRDEIPLHIVRIVPLVAEKGVAS